MAIRMVNFRCYVDATCRTVRGVNLFVTGNGEGKTTLEMAIEYAMTGRALGVTDEAGRGADSLIRTGAEGATVEALLVDRDGQQVGVRRSVYRKAPTRLEVQGVAGSATVLQEHLAHRFGPPEIVSIALQASRYLDLSVAEQQAVLTRLAGSAWTLDDVAAALGDEGAPARTALDWCSAGMDAVDLDAIEKRARAARADARKERDQAIGAAAVGPEGRRLSEADVAAAQQRLAQLGARRDELQREIGRRDMTLRAHQHADAERARLTAEIDRLADQVGDYAQRADVATPRASVQGLTAALASRRAALEEASATVAAAAEEESFLRQALERASTPGAGDGGCPMCPEIRCGISKAAAADVIERLVATAAARTLEASGAQADAAKELRAVEGGLERARAAVVAAEAAEAALIRAREALAGRQDALKDLTERNLTPPESSDDLRAESEKIAAEISGVRRQLAEHEAAASGAQRVSEAQARTVQAQARWAALDDLCKAFTDGSLRAALLRDVRGRFVSLAQDALSAMVDEDVTAQLSVDEDGSIGVTSGAWPGLLPVDLLSRSMRLRVGIAVSHALCQLARFPLLLIDDADALDFDNRNLLLGALLDLREQYGQILVLAAQPTAELPRDPGIEGLAFWTIRDGEIVRLAATEGATA